MFDQLDVIYLTERRKGIMTIKELQTIIKDIENSPLMTLELEMDDFKLKLSKNKYEKTEPIYQEPKKTETIEVKELAVDQTKGQHIKSPLVGTFYLSPTINGNPYVEVGQMVKKGQVVCIIEAMKIMNEITSPYDGILKDVLIRNGEVVGYDQTIMVIE